MKQDFVEIATVSAAATAGVIAYLQFFLSCLGVFLIAFGIIGIIFNSIKIWFAIKNPNQLTEQDKIRLMDDLFLFFASFMFVFGGSSLIAIAKYFL